MKKFILVETGKEIKLGDKVTLMFEFETDFGNINVVETTVVTKENIKTLVKDGKVKLVEDDKVKITEDTLDTIWDNSINSIRKKTGWTSEELGDILSTLNSVNSWATLQFILKEIAIELDKKYKDYSTNNSDEIYAISPQDGHIHKLDKSTIKSYKAFPAFRTLEDAKLAYNVVKEHLKHMFNA